MKPERVGFVVRDTNSSWECMRTLFGFLTENYWCSLFLVDCPVQLPPEMSEEEFLEHLEMFTEDMEADFFTTVEADAKAYQYLKLLPVEEMTPKMRECELIIPF